MIYPRSNDHHIAVGHGPHADKEVWQWHSELEPANGALVVVVTIKEDWILGITLRKQSSIRIVCSWSTWLFLKMLCTGNWLQSPIILQSPWHWTPQALGLFFLGCCRKVVPSMPGNKKGIYSMYSTQAIYVIYMYYSSNLTDIIRTLPY